MLMFHEPCVMESSWGPCEDAEACVMLASTHACQKVAEL
jgi:hypothetical protein